MSCKRDIQVIHIAAPTIWARRYIDFGEQPTGGLRSGAVGFDGTGGDDCDLSELKVILPVSVHTMKALKLSKNV